MKYKYIATLLMLTGCTSMGAYDSDRRILGVINSTNKIHRASEPPAILKGFGLIGGLIAHAESQPKLTNVYVVRTAALDLYTVQVDEEWALETCVEIIPAKDAIGGKGYVYGQARLVRSDKCVKEQ